MADRDINKAKESVYDAANKIGGAAQSQYEQTKSAAKDAAGTAQDKTHSFLGTAQDKAEGAKYDAQGKAKEAHAEGKSYLQGASDKVGDMLGTGQKKAEEVGDKAGAHAEGAKKEGKGYLNQAVDLVQGTTASVVSGAAGIVKDTAKYVGDKADEFKK